MKLNLQALTIVALCLVISGCATMCKQQVPPGHVGMCRTADGFTGKPLPAGWHTCWGSDAEMYYIEVSDHEQVINMNVLCKDSLNFKFDVSVLVAADRKNEELLRDMFVSITPDKGSVITSEQIFATYARSVVDQEARKVVANYMTTEIVAKRPQIIEEIRQSVGQSLEGTIVEVKRVTVNNLDFPEVITKAQETRASRQVEIETERAEQEKRVLKAQHQLKVASIEYEQQLLEAAMIADSNKIIRTSITPEYLAWWQMKVMSEAASGPNNWGFIPYTDFGSDMTTNPRRWTTGKGLMDEELRRKVSELRKKAQDDVRRSDTAAAEATPAEAE